MEIKEKHINKYSIYIGGLFTLLIVLVFIMNNFEVKNYSLSDQYKNMMKFKNIHSVVKAKFEDSRNHAAITFSFKNAFVNLSSLPKSWINLTEVGDSISKERGQLMFYLYKKNGEYYELDYQLYLDRMDKNGYLD